MYRVFFEDLHREHLEWLSQIKFWKEELQTLRLLCKKKCVNKKVPAKIYCAEIFIQLDHQERLLTNMESQIHSHENFIVEMIQSSTPEKVAEGMSDHDHNRKHMVAIVKSIKKLKIRILKEIETEKTITKK